MTLRRPGPKVDRAIGDLTGLTFPAHAEALREDGATFLTHAFRAFGAIGLDNDVARIVSMEPCGGGSTGDKLFLCVEYSRPAPHLHTDLFVKFSRDFADPIRDMQRGEMAGEARFMALAREPGFPIKIPAALFADFHDESGTGLIVTERIPYGSQGIEPHRRKCLDHLTMDDPLPHYRALVTALARLVAADKAGRLAGDVDALFPFDPAEGSSDPIRSSEEKLAAQLASCADFARRCPLLLPPELRTPEFLARMERDALRIHRAEATLQAWLTGNPDLIGLCHWNAHIDNGWFWREADGQLRCGLIDWGRVGRMTFGSALWGGLSAAHHDIWDHHLGELLSLFADELAAHGGPRIDPETLRLHLVVHMAVMGVARVLDFPKIILLRLPEAVDAAGPHDAMFEPVDPARNCLHIYTSFLKVWERDDFGAALDRVLSLPR